ncbi:hypothetical protein ACEPAG_3869 [Sanghuangporus baumii]
MAGLDTVQTALTLVKGIAENVHSFLDARSSADRHDSKYRLEKACMTFWEHLAEEHSRASNRDERVKFAFTETFGQTQSYFSEYERLVKRWHRLVGSDFGCETDRDALQEQYAAGRLSLFKTENVTEDGRPPRKRFAPISRAKYIVFGDRKITRAEKSYKESEKTFSSMVLASSTMLGRIDMENSPPAPAGVSALYRFIGSAKKRVETSASIVTISRPNLSKYEIISTIIDPKTLFCQLSAIVLKRGSLRLKETAEDIEGLQSYEDCIIVKRSGGDHKESLELARLFAEDSSDKFSRGFFTDPPDGAMLRCCAVVRKNSEFDLYFRIPEGCSVQTLRQILPTSSSSRPTVSKRDRVKFSIRLATAVLVVHSLGLVHKLIHPETIIVTQKEIHLSENPNRLGFPYLAAFQSARSDVGVSLKKSDIEAYAKRGIYFHPRDQREGETRAERYTMEDDIYSLGVCLFEVGLWRSLLVWEEESYTYVYDDSFVRLSDRNTWTGSSLREKAREKLKVLVEEARRLLPKAISPEYAEVVISCLTVGYEINPLNDEYVKFRDENTDDPVAWKYLDLVLSKLRRVHDSCSRR